MILFIVFFQFFNLAPLLTLPEGNITDILTKCKDDSIWWTQFRPGASRSVQFFGGILNTASLQAAPGIELVPVSTTHAAALAGLVGRNILHLQAYMPRVATLATVEAAEAHLHYAADMVAQGELHEWHIYTGGSLAGSVRVNHIEEEHWKASVGFFLGQEFQGAGLATAAVRAVIRHCFEQLDYNRIELQCASANMPSQGLAKRLGFTWEGMLRQAEMLNGAYVDLFVYGLLRDDFDSRQAA